MTSEGPRFIAADVEPDSAPQFRRDFALAPGHGIVESASLRLSALGICEAWISGVPVSSDVLTPGWTSYEWRVHYAEYEVAALLGEANTLGIAVGNGWYRGRLGWIETAKYGDALAAYAELRIRFADGHEQLIVTDDTWTAGPSATTFDDFYDGQTIDARRRSDAWQKPGFTDPAWGSVHTVAYEGEVVADPAPPTRRVEHVPPQRIWRSPSGAVLVDFGQNLVGWVRVHVRGAEGAEITLRHAEVLDGGELATAPLRSARATDTYILSGRDDTFEPTFTFHGFRYAELRGWPEAIEAISSAQLTAVAISTDLTRTGTFECSVPELNQLHQNVVRGMRGNFIDIPTDCPQRDERLGWTGDIAAFAPTAAFLYDVKDFLSDWLRDLALEQADHDGIVPYVVPDILKHASAEHEGASASEAAAFWSDAAVWVPWALWEAYGDLGVLEMSFPSMLAHGRRVRGLLSPSGVWDAGFQFGDWLDPDAPPDRPGAAKADKGVVATAAAFRTADRIRTTAELLGRTAEAKEFALMSSQLREAFQREYVLPDRIRSDCATVYALAICFGLLDAEQEAWAGARLAVLVQESGYRISTGFAGTPFVTDALTSTGHIATAFALLLQRECPSWLYPVTMGATTIWERWDSMLPDGTINPDGMTSFNHYALGAVADWMHRVVGGLAPLEPGYRRILVAPALGVEIDWARTTLETPHGLAAVAWARHDDRVTLDITVPEGTSAVLRWPDCADREFAAGRHTLTLEVPAHAGRQVA